MAKMWRLSWKKRNNYVCLLLLFTSITDSGKICDDFKINGSEEYTTFIETYQKYVGYSPAGPKLKEFYNINAEMYAIHPLIAFLCNRSNDELIQEDHTFWSAKGVDRMYFMVESIPSNDKLKDDYKGELCLLHYDQPEDIWMQKRFDPALMTKNCSTDLSFQLPVLGNMLVVQGLMHTLPSNKPRKYRLSIVKKVSTRQPNDDIDPFVTEEFWIYGDCGVQTAIMRSHLYPFTGMIEVWTPCDFESLSCTRTKHRVKGVRWSKPKDANFNSENIIANTPFEMELEIINDRDEVISDGFGSKLMVHVTLSSEYKYFFKNGHKADFLAGTSAELGTGEPEDEVQISKRNHDRVLHKLAENGTVTFKNVRILDTTKGTTLTFLFNATLLIPGGIWARVPFDYKDMDCFEENTYGRIQSYVKNMDKDIVKSEERVMPKSKNGNRDKAQGKRSLPPTDETLVYRFKHDPTCYGISSGVAFSQRFPVDAQKPGKLVLVKEYLKTVKTMEFVANYPIDGIILELRDDNDRRIYTGDASWAIVSVVTDPSSVPVSEDGKTIQLVYGRGEFTGSIVEPNTEVMLCFSVKVSTEEGQKELTSNCTDVFKIVGKIPIAVFAMLSSSGSSSDPDPLIMTYAQFAVEHINEKLAVTYPKDESDIYQQVPVLPEGREFSIAGYDTKWDLFSTMIAYKKLVKEGKKNPSKLPRAVIGFSFDDLTYSMYPLTAKDKITLIGVRETRREHDEAGHLLRLNWDERALYECLAQMFVNRLWTKIALLRSASSEVSEVFYKAMREAKIEIVVDVFFPQHPEVNWTQLEDTFRFKMKQILLSGTKIIFSNIRSPIQYFVYRLANKYNVSGQHGYQWVAAEIPAMEFPVRNHHPVCYSERPWCSEIMVGMLLLVSAHELNYETDLWQLVHWKYFEADPTLYRGIQKARPSHLVSQYARAYDAVLAYARAVLAVINEKKTVTMEDIVSRIKKDTFRGLTGEIKFHPTGARAGNYAFIGALLSIRKNPASADTPHSYTEQLCRYVYYDPKKKSKNQSVIEVLHESNFETKSEVGNPPVGIMTLPVTNRTNVRDFWSKRGMMSYDSVTTVLMEEDELKNINLPKKKWKRSAPEKKVDPEETILRKEEVIQTFYCVRGCGGEQTDSSDRNQYDNGICYALNSCRCKSVGEAFPDRPLHATAKDNKAYSGETCEDKVCSTGCVHGKCIGPDFCECDYGYTGHSCDEHFCGDAGCGIGTCLDKKVCQCPAAYSGENCHILLSLIISPIVSLLGLVAFCATGLILQWREKQKWKEMITATDWLVRWADVYMEDTSPSLTSTVVTGPTFFSKSKESKQAKYSGTLKTVVLWKNQKCYAELFDSESLNMSNPLVQMEMLQLLHLRHPNLAVFAGACLDAPTVAILTEYYPKGSLEDLLPSRKLPLDWDVKFSILKDIARGMDYIHGSPIESHGRLKSSNCLMDNRWSIRITGFGAPMLRSERKQGERGEYNPKFAIIVSEVCSEAQPYNLERAVLSPEEIVLLLKSPDDPGNRGLKKTWISFGGSSGDAIRPAIQKQQLPTEILEKNGLISLMSKCWQEEAFDRPTFKEVLHLLNVMRPVRGDLVDLLIKRLEKYSTKLEEQFVEASKELQTEKLKIEELLARLLPRTIVDDMVHGKKVEAEAFEMATICFSDLADFLHLAEKATPFQIIELLNSLYIVFDNIIDNYDAYKVETVRDEYMVVSGLPVRNGYVHASEIATLALHLMSAVTNFKIKFMPAKRLLMLRIGMHSGPVVAGVVGLHMPRYCLFGDTVNTASRMKTSCTALRIHMSEHTVNILKIIGGFDIELRGEREVKGRGMMTTYWLNGKEGFVMPLPDKSLAVAAELQEFK